MTQLPSKPNLSPSPGDGPGSGRTAALFGWLGRIVPTLLVLLALGGLAAWGRHTAWKIPKFSRLMGDAQEEKDWCAEHGVPESECVECRPGLLPRAKTPYCKKHGVPECPLDYPAVAQIHGRPH